MPTYEYECEACKHVEERFEFSTDPKNTHPCPMDGATMRKLISGGGAVIAGTRVSYPAYNPCLPVAKGEKPGGPSQIVHSHQDLVNKCAKHGLAIDQL